MLIKAKFNESSQLKFSRSLLMLFFFFESKFSILLKKSIGLLILMQLSSTRFILVSQVIIMNFIIQNFHHKICKIFVFVLKKNKFSFSFTERSKSFCLLLRSTTCFSFVFSLFFNHFYLFFLRFICKFKFYYYTSLTGS